MEQSEQETITSLIRKSKLGDEPSNSAISSKINEKPRLTSAEKMRAYRQRQREKQMTKNSSVLEVPQDDFDINDSEQSYVRQTTSTDSSTMNKKPRLTSAQKVRAYRQRQREKRITENSSVFEVLQDNRKNNYLEQSNNRPTTSSDSSTMSKKPPMTSAEKVRAYRQRQREKQMYVGPTTSTDSSKMNKNPPLTPAERMRAYRRRQREKRITENSSVFEVLQENRENNSFEKLNNRPSTSTDTFTICGSVPLQRRLKVGAIPSQFEWRNKSTVDKSSAVNASQVKEF